jgi:hypothetical protein
MEGSQQEIVFESQQALSQAIAEEADEVGEEVARKNSFKLPKLNARVPVPGDAIAFYAGLGAITALGVIEWPLALVVGGGHLIRTYSHSQALQGAVDDLEEEVVDRLIPSPGKARKRPARERQG